MKRLTAIIRPHILEAARDALQLLGINGVTVSQVKGYGRQHGHTELYRGTEYRIDFVPKVQLELVIDDTQLASAIETITTLARTGKFGDGKLFVSDIDQVFRVRTGETGYSAL